MLGLLVIIVVSWGLLRFIEKKNIKALGIIPLKKHLVQFLLGFLIIALIGLISIYIDTMIRTIKWESKPVNYVAIFDAIIYHLKSALTEDLVFRGALLYILIQRSGLY